jgi:uncharacterized protein YxjI
MGLLRNRTDAPGGERAYKLDGRALVGIRDRVDVAPGEDPALVLALTVAIDPLTSRG